MSNKNSNIQIYWKTVPFLSGLSTLERRLGILYNKIRKTNRGAAVMDTLVELFDKEPVENIYAAVALQPKQVVYIGDSRLMTAGRQENIRRFFAQKSSGTKLHFYSIRTDDVEQIGTVLEEITQRFDNCVCDVTGGTDLLLVSVGILCARKKIPVLFFNIHTGNFVNVSGCEDFSSFSSPSLTVENLMALAGGAFIRHGHYSPELEVPETRDIIEAVWEVLRTDIPGWGKQASYFQQAAKGSENGNESLTVRAPVHIHVNFRNIVHCNPRFMIRLAETGAIRNYRMENDRVRYTYRNPLFRRLLSDAGVWLELYTYYTAQRTNFFDDLQTSVLIDWDGNTESNGTVNELDDILINGIVPLFISCKIGVPSVLAINEIDSLARRFGGSMAKPVLVTASRLDDIPEPTRQRAADMGVTLLDAGNMSRSAFARSLMKLAGASKDYFKRR